MAGRPTYDPMVGSQWRTPGGPQPPLWAPPPGRALVLVPGDGPLLTVWPGQPLPAATPAPYQAAFLLDTAEHELTLPLHLPCAEPGFALPREVTLLCRVADPALVVAHGIRDVGSALYGPLRDALTAVTRAHPAAAVAAAAPPAPEPTPGQTVFACGCLLVLVGALITGIVLLVLHWGAAWHAIGHRHHGSDATAAVTAKPAPDARPTATVAPGTPRPKELVPLMPDGSGTGSVLLAVHIKDGHLTRYAEGVKKWSDPLTPHSAL